MKSKMDICDLVELNFKNPKVAGLVSIIITRSAQAESNFRKDFLNPLLEYLGYILGSEVHLISGDIDYAYEIGNYIVGIESKPPSIVQKHGAYIYMDELKKHIKQVHQYFSDPSLNFLVLTDGISWYFYSKKSIRKHPPHYLDIRTTQLLQQESTQILEHLSKHKIVDSLQRWEDESEREGLDEKFYRALKFWVEACQNYFMENNKISEYAAKSESVALINKLIFIRSLEDFGSLPFNYLRKKVKEYLDHWGPEEGSKQLSSYINDWMFKHYDTELFANNGITLSAQLWEYLILGKFFFKASYLFTPSLCDFNFANIDFDILGHVYERFLADLKRERGIYYTRRFVVEYIVDNTIGQRINSILSKAYAKLNENNLDESKSIIENELFGLRILDLAPGSGSFLICAFDILREAYEEWEKNYIEKYNELYKDDKILITLLWTGGQRVIDDWKEKLILSCLYGCDIDKKAVDVAKLNMWLRLIRSEPDNYYWKKLQDKKIFHALPNLSLNLITGNSIIAAKFKLTEKEPLNNYKAEFNKIEKLRMDYMNNFKSNLKNIDKIEKLKSPIRKKFREYIKKILAQEKLDTNWAELAIVWPLEFPFEKFDFVIGNPPYIGEEDHKDMLRPVKVSPLLSEYYESKMDYWYFFCHLGISLLKDDGKISFIVPHYWPTSEGAKKLIKRIVNETSIESIFDFNEYKVFKEMAPGQHNMVFRFKKSKDKINPKIAIIKRTDLSEKEVVRALHGENVEGILLYEANRQDTLLDLSGKLHFINKNIDSICNRIKDKSNGVLGGENGFCNVNQGIIPAIDTLGIKQLKRLLRLKGITQPTEIQILELERELGIKRNDEIFVLSISSLKKLKLTKNEKELIKPFFWGYQIKRFYAESKNSHIIIYTTIKKAKDIENHPEKYPNIKAHLDKYQSVITSDFRPYGLHRARDENIFISEKIISLRQTKYPTFAYTKIPYYIAMVCNIITKKESYSNISLKSLLAILNSKLAYFWFYYKGKRKGEQLQIDVKPLEDFPIKLPSNNISEELDLLVGDIENCKETYFQLINKWYEGIKIICGEQTSLDYLFKWPGVLITSDCKTSIDPDQDIENIAFEIKDSYIIVQTNIGDDVYSFKDKLLALHVLYYLKFLFKIKGLKIKKLKSFLNLKIPYASEGLFEKPSLENLFKELESFAVRKKLTADLSYIENEIIKKQQEINKIVAGLYDIRESDLIVPK